MNVVEAQGVEIQRGDHVVVKSASFLIPQGQVTAVIGPNGSGKTSILHAIAGLLPVSAGRLEVLGKTAGINTRVSYVLQGMAPTTNTPLSVKEAVSMGRYANRGWWARLRQEDKDAVAAAMAMTQVQHLADRQLAELSGGQQQRVFLAQGLAQPYALLLLDEPLTGVDIPSAQAIDNIIHNKSNRRHGIIFTTHDLDEARASDHVVLVGGSQVTAGTPTEVLTRDSLERAFGLGALHDWQGFMDEHHDH